MFELFAQGDRTLARSEGGLGIGLTIVKKLVEMHGGSVRAVSEGPGKGSEFTIRLPAAERAAVGRAEAAGPAQPSTTKSRILVVDDNVDTACGMASILDLLGHEVVTAHSGPEALRAAGVHRPDFILLDIGLPGMDGYQVASRLRQDESCKEAFIVAVSGYGQEEDRRRSREAGFDHHLIKPLDLEAFLSLLSARKAARSGCQDRD
jgi:CheY-like chemotaxis protein